MQDQHLNSALDILSKTTSDKLVERKDCYSEKTHKDQRHFKIFESERVTGEISHPSLSGKNNVLIRGYKSESSGSKISINGNNNIVFLGPHSKLSNASIRITAENSLFYFGAFSTVESITTILSGSDGKIIIGDFCMLSARIVIDRSDHHSIYDISSGQKINHDQDVIISNHVWISRDVKISKGSTIGKDSVIGQSAVVSGNLLPSCSYAGVPATCRRENITWSRMNSSSIGEMERSERHQEFTRNVENIKLRM